MTLLGSKHWRMYLVMIPKLAACILLAVSVIVITAQVTLSQVDERSRVNETTNLVQDIEIARTSQDLHKLAANFGKYVDTKEEQRDERNARLTTSLLTIVGTIIGSGVLGYFALLKKLAKAGVA